MKKQILKTLFLLFISSIFLGTSVNITEAFLDSDLGLNLYKDLDEGLKDFEEKMYVYELSEQDKKNISKSVNKILFNNNLGSCLIDGITPTTFSDISEGNIKVLLNNMKKECYNSDTGVYNTKKVGTIISEISKIKEYYLEKSERKAKEIHSISRIGMYSDGNLDNSPFDIISDLDDINAIIFSTPIDYESEDVNFLKDYKNKPLIGPLGNSLGGNNGGNNGKSGNNNNSNTNTNNSGTDSTDSETNNGGETYIDNTNDEQNPDGNNYICPVNESGLDNDSVYGLLGSIEGGNNGNGDTFNYGSGGHTPLPSTNTINNPNIPSLLSENFESEMLANSITPYEAITDKDIWKCNEYFCITTEFIVNNKRALSYSSDHSIENIIKKSNKHLKKAMNTSLVQSKMTTNNFEISLRDLNLVDMFHMGIQVSYKSPPILNLEDLPGDKVKDMFMQKYKNLGLDYEKPNNLNKFNQSLKKMKSIILTSENPGNRAIKINNQLKETLKLRSKILDYNKEIISKKINNDIIKDFETQFKEITQFNINIFDYVNNLDVLIKKLKEIPIYTG